MEKYALDRKIYDGNNTFLRLLNIFKEWLLKRGEIYNKKSPKQEKAFNRKPIGESTYDFVQRHFIHH